MQAGPEQLQIAVAHTLPGRLRLRLSHPPHRAEKTVRMVKSHPGVQSVAYTGPTRNLLVLFDPEQITLEEIILRAALCLSADYDLKAVAIKASGAKVPLSVLSILAGLSLLVAHLMSLFYANSKAFHAVQMICGLGTTVAVSEHIYLDFKNKGKLHPEVLSIGYLLTSFLRKKVLKGATIAWVMTFARHLMEPPAKVLKLEAKATDPACDEHQCEYKAKISRELTSQGYTGLINRLPQLLLGMYTDMQLTTEDRVFKEIQKLSREHNDVLEGLANLNHGIRLQVGS